MNRANTTQSLVWFLDLRKVGRLNLDPEYQRLSVWNKQYKKFFIDTILRDYPCPAIFLEKTYDADYQPIYSVIDGKQRLTTIFDYVDGIFETVENENEPNISEKYFEDLESDLKRRLLNYNLGVEIVSETNIAELKEIFDRMNRNVSKLNAQELRHAKYSGQFISLCESYVQDQWFRSSAVCAKRRSERMSDVEYISELVVLTERGPQDGKSILDIVYADYDIEFVTEPEVNALFMRIFEQVKQLGLSDTERSPFGSLADIYSVWAAIREVLQDGATIDIARSRDSLLTLAEEIDAKSSEAGTTYYILTQRQTNSLASRTKRAIIVGERLVRLT